MVQCCPRSSGGIPPRGVVMALVLEAAVRTEIIARRRYVLDKRVAFRLSAVLWVAAGRTVGRPAAPGRGRGRPQAAEPPGGVRPRRPGVPGPPLDPGQQQQPAVRELAAGAEGQAPRDGAVHPVPGQRPILPHPGSQGVASSPPRVPPGAPAGLLPPFELDRAAVEVLAKEGIHPLAQDLRGDAAGRVRGVGPLGQLPGRVGHAPDREVPTPPPRPGSGLIANWLPNGRNASFTDAIDWPGEPAEVIQDEQVSTVTQAQLQEFLEIRAQAWKYKPLHEQLATLLQAGAWVEPGRLTAKVELIHKSIFSNEALTPVLGEARVRELLHAVEPTVFRHLLIHETPPDEA